MPKPQIDCYKDFQDWLSGHRHSACTIESECQQCFDTEEGTLTEESRLEALEDFADRMEELRNEAQGEVNEAQEWIKRFKKEKQDKA